MTSISERVRTLLESLGDTPDAVADSLRQRGIKGTREDGCDCPIARLIQAEIPESRKENGAKWDDRDGAWFACGSYVTTPEGRLYLRAASVGDFIELFDNGEPTDEYGVEYPYADLEDR